jgi:hypothetical protein
VQSAASPGNPALVQQRMHQTPRSAPNDIGHPCIARLPLTLRLTIRPTGSIRNDEFPPGAVASTICIDASSRTRLHRESDMATLHRHGQSGRRLRAAMSVAAALCILGFASLVWLHNPAEPILANSHAAAAVWDAPASASVSLSTTSGQHSVPSAESVFRGSAYVAPEEPIAQF